jgi:protoheme IX farnesyltransferase
MRTDIGSKGEIAIGRSRVADYVALTKPELTFLSVLTALAGYYLGSGGSLSGMGMLHTLLGTAMVGGGAGAINQYMERHLDALMKRTEQRPLPAGRVSAGEALVFGTALTLAGILELVLLVNPLTGFLAALTSVTYLFLYTPLKRITPFSTLVGGIPGALPPVMGWTAARNEINAAAWVLFGILFLWQMPHFLSLAWMYRKDYARAGYRLLTVLDTKGTRTVFYIIASTTALVPVSGLLSATGSTGTIYAAGALLAGIALLVPAVRLASARSSSAARVLFFASLLYLPALMLALVLDRIFL